MADTTTTADYAIAAPHGGMILIPARVAPGTDPYLHMTSAAQRRAYYEEHGYVVIRGLASDAACDAARAAYEREVKSYPGFLYRQATANPEKHLLTAHGHVLNSLLNSRTSTRGASHISAPPGGRHHQSDDARGGRGPAR